MSRLAELRRQRALLQEHLAWLDREIAATADAATPSAALSDRSSPSSLSRDIPVVARSAAPELVTSLPTAGLPFADTMLDEYRLDPRALKSDVRKGCLIYFAAAFALLILAVTILYFALSAR